MFGKLAFRNVRRQLGNYLIYFITVTLTIAMMFALCNLIFSNELLDYAKNMSKLMGGLIGLSVVVALIVAFVLGYATSFMLKLRKREFGTYLTLGMTRKNILCMFAVENLLIGVVALGAGLLLGLVIFQGMIGIVAYVLEIKIALASYSLTGLLMTIGLTCGIFLLSTITSTVYLKKVTIYDLLHAEKKMDRATKHPVLWMVVTVLSFAGIVVSIIGCYDMMRSMLLSAASDTENSSSFMLYIVLLAVSVVFYHIGFAKSAVNILLKNEKIKSSGTNTFVLRQLSGQLGANSVLCGIIAFLITATVICTNVCFGQKTTVNQFLNHEFPFDITANLTAGDNAPFSYEESRDIIGQYADIHETVPYKIYTSGNGYLHTFTPWSGYENLHDNFIKESDFNKLVLKLGYKPVSLDREFLIVANNTKTMGCDFSGAELQLNGSTYHFKEMTDQYPSLLHFAYFLTVIPDEAATGMETDAEYAAMDLENTDFDAQALYDQLTYTTQNDSGDLIERCEFYIHEYYAIQENSMTAIMIVGELYLAIIFVFMTVAILTMKLLSGISEDKKRFKLLYQLGTSKDEQKKALFRQVFSYFAVPLVLPILLSIPAAFICSQLVKFGGYPSLVPQMYANASIIALILIATHILYFSATYYVEKRSVLY